MQCGMTSVEYKLPAEAFCRRENVLSVELYLEPIDSCQTICVHFIPLKQIADSS